MRFIVCLFAMLTMAMAHAAPDNLLQQIRRKGEVVYGVKDSSPPFSQHDPKTNSLKGYDIEFAQGIAKRLGVKPVFRLVEGNDRLPWIKQGKIDLVVANLSRTVERDKEIDFSIGYFITDTKVLAKKGRFKSENDLNNAYLATTSGSSTAKMLRKNYPKTKLAEFEDTPEMEKALTANIVEGLVDDTPVLISALMKMPVEQRKLYEVSEFGLELSTLAVGLKQGEKELQQAVNNALIDMEKTGEAEAIFNRWFGPKSNIPMMRVFSISTHRVE